jgi:hypothetical protein
MSFEQSYFIPLAVQLADFVESQVVQVIQDLQALLPNELA